MPIMPEKQLEIYHAAFQFLSPLAFDLRGTLTGVMVAAELLSKSDLSAEQRALVEQIARAGRTALPTLGATFDFLRLVGGEQLPHGPVLISLREQLAVIVARAGEAGKRAISLAVSPDVPGTLHCDSYVPRVITALVASALSLQAPDSGQPIGLALDLARPAEDEQVVLRCTVRCPEAGSAGRLAAMDGFLRQPPGEALPDMACGFEFTIARYLVDVIGGQIRLERDAAGGAVRWVYEFAGEK